MEQELEPILQGLKKIYRQKILPVEKMYKFNEFHSPSLTNADLEAKPMVLLIGQYSTGKTSFIRYLLERSYIGMHIGDQPTTDRFVAIMDGVERRIPGNALVVDRSKPFSGLSTFGMSFYERLECVQCESPILKKVTFIDTPGVLSGEKQRIGRGYDFATVIKWFSGRVDRIVLLFDAYKLDISDEFKEAIGATRGNDDKIRVVLNKADLPMQQLMRVYGALMWSLGKVFGTPEVLRVYVGSFWNKPVKNEEVKALLAKEHLDLLSDLRSLPRNALMRKMNEMIKRAKMARMYGYILGHLSAQFGFFTKKANKQQQLLKGLFNELKIVSSKYNLPKADMNPNKIREKIQNHNLWEFPKLDEKKLEGLTSVLSKDLPRLMAMNPEFGVKKSKDNAVMSNPFAAENNDVGRKWLIDQAMKTGYDNKFYSVSNGAREIDGGQCKPIMLNSQLPMKVLHKIWALSDIEGSGTLDRDEFAVMMYLVEGAQKNNAQTADDIPSELPPNLVPPSKRNRDL